MAEQENAGQQRQKPTRKTKQRLQLTEKVVRFTAHPAPPTVMGFGGVGIGVSYTAGSGILGSALCPLS